MKSVCLCSFVCGKCVVGAKTLEIALIWILSVSSNHNHVTGSPCGSTDSFMVWSAVLAFHYLIYIFIMVPQQEAAPAFVSCAMMKRVRPEEKHKYEAAVYLRLTHTNNCRSRSLSSRRSRVCVLVLCLSSGVRQMYLLLYADIRIHRGRN